jgi:superfamily II DNA or RNA helicase
MDSTIILPGPAWTKVWLASDEQVFAQTAIEIDKATSWWVEGAQFSPKFRGYAKQESAEPLTENDAASGTEDGLLLKLSQKVSESSGLTGGSWDGRNHLWHPWDATFPTGLLPRVICALKAAKLPYQIDDQRVYPKIENPICELDGITLRTDQLEAVRAGVDHPCGVIWNATGAGKTEIAIAIDATLGQFPTLWLTHTKYLWNQTKERYEKRLRSMGLRIGRIGDGVYEPGDITIGLVQSFYQNRRNRQFLVAVRHLISDECHHLQTAVKSYNICMACPALYRHAVSATPYEGSDASMRLEAAFGPLIYWQSAKQAEVAGAIVRPEVWMIDYADGCQTTEQEFGDKMSLEEYKVFAETKIVGGEVRNNVLVDLAVSEAEEGRKVLLIVRRIPHGKLLEQRIVERLGGVAERSIFINGTTHQLRREEAVNLFASGVCRVLIASPILDEGADVPAIETVVVAVGGNSVIKTIQWAGRGTRKKIGGEVKNLRVYDLIDRQHPLSLRHSLDRWDAFKKIAKSVRRLPIGNLKNVVEQR